MHCRVYCIRGVGKMRISDLSKRLGIRIYTLRYYEKEGIIQNIARDEKGRRVYTENDAKWLEFIIRLRKMQMPIQKMKRYAQLRYGGDVTISERRSLLESHRQTLEAKVNELKDSIAFLDRKIQVYDAMEGKTYGE